MGGRLKQKPGEYYKFSCGHECILPADGESNKEAGWRPYSRCKQRGGRHACQKCNRIRSREYFSGVSRHGLMGPLDKKIQEMRRRSKRLGYSPPNFSCIDLYDLYIKTDSCDWCGELCGIGKLHIDHNHSNGDFRNLLCIRCNFIEGMFASYKDDQKCMVMDRLKLSIPEKK